MVRSAHPTRSIRNSAGRNVGCVLRTIKWRVKRALLLHRLESLCHRSFTWFISEPQADEELLTAYC
jgi:hypothetical protein